MRPEATTFWVHFPGHIAFSLYGGSRKESKLLLESALVDPIEAGTLVAY
jgi:hypothetical protein